MRAKSTLGTLVLLFLVAAIGQAQPPEKPKPSGGAKPAAPGSSSKAAPGKIGTPADEAAVRALAEQYEQAFNSDDPTKAADIFAESGVFVDEAGKTFEGRSEIAKDLGTVTGPNRVRLALTVDAVRLIKPDVGLMRGTSAASGGDVPPGGGKGHWAVVAMKVAGQWKVIAAQAAVDQPPPPAK